MKVYSTIAYVVVVVSVLLLSELSTVVVVEANQVSGCVTDGTTGVDLFPHKAIPTVATAWNVSYYNTYKIVTNLATNVTLLLYQCGTTIPTAETDSVINSTNFTLPPIAVPITKVSVAEVNTLTFLEQLGVTSSIVVYHGNVSYISSPCIQQSIQLSNTYVIADEAELTAIKASPSLSAATVLNDDSIIAFVGAFDTEFPFGTNKSIVTSTQNELTNNGIFEWIKFYSLFYNLEEKANTIFDAAATRSTCVKTSASTTTADKTKPIVLWAYYSDYCGGWDIGKCPNYYCEFANDCSATMIYTDYDTGSIDSVACGAKYFNITELVKFGVNADVWIFSSDTWDATYEKYGIFLQTMKSVKNQQVYDLLGSGINAWFETRYGEYYDVTQDFCSIVNTTTSLLNNKKGWFRNVFTTPLSLGTDIAGGTTIVDSTTLAQECTARTSTLLMNTNTTTCDFTIQPPKSTGSTTGDGGSTTSGGSTSTSNTTTTSSSLVITVSTVASLSTAVLVAGQLLL